MVCEKENADTEKKRERERERESDSSEFDPVVRNGSERRGGEMGREGREEKRGEKEGEQRETTPRHMVDHVRVEGAKCPPPLDRTLFDSRQEIYRNLENRQYL